MPNGIFQCSSCGQQHLGLPASFAADYPDPYANLSVEARELRALISSDQCIVDQQEFYIRGCLEVPIIGTDEMFIWGLWARMNETDFDEISDHWEREGRENLVGPYKGRLANALPIYTDTLNQRVEIRISPVGTRPLFMMEDAGTVLFDEQHSGLSPQKATEYACLLLRLANL
jgi:hypothetical protein